MKMAKVSVIYNGGDKHTMNNYRPILVLPLFSKALDQIIFKSLHHFFLRHSLVTVFDFGFLENISTEPTLLLQKLIIKTK